ncbi:hypothetical protein RD792_010614 [Penstemon davidsonii]|uniref:Cytochrome P450 n=1 Tax=Penstemon davidsonii TaxID=160366 RepID=A0ABR0D2C0_9LAMI|nr:hypothetical protein RD792_010614 [Penstemon davidsonii]
MELLQTVLVLLLCFALWLCIGRLKLNFGNRNSSKLPPGPKPFPIIGNILELGQNPHKSLAKLSKTYGPLMRLKLGSMTMIVVSSPETAQLVLQKYDQNFSDRPTLEAGRPLDHLKFSVAWLPAASVFRPFRLRPPLDYAQILREGPTHMGLHIDRSDRRLDLPE